MQEITNFFTCTYVIIIGSFVRSRLCSKFWSSLQHSSQNWVGFEDSASGVYLRPRDSGLAASLQHPTPTLPILSTSNPLSHDTDSHHILPQPTPTLLFLLLTPTSSTTNRFQHLTTSHAWLAPPSKPLHSSLPLYRPPNPHSNTYSRPPTQTPPPWPRKSS